MKTLKFEKVTIVIVLFGITTLSSCEKDTAHSKITNMQVSDFAKIGEIHNAFLTNTINNFYVLDEVVDEKEKIEFIKEFNKDFVSSLDLPSEDKHLLIWGLEEHKDLVVTPNLIRKSFGQDDNKSEKAGDENIFSLIEALYNSNQIGHHSYNMLLKLSNDVKANHEQLLSDKQLKLNIQSLVSEFDSFGYDSNSREGEMVGSILAISMASIEWWDEYSDPFGNAEESKVLPAWAAADIIGAAWGGATGAISSYIGTGEVNWTAVGVGAVSGAVAGSTGAVGKIAKWLIK